jgi:hypothetical protein
MRLLDSLGKDHDEEIYKWSRQLENTIVTDSEVSSTYIRTYVMYMHKYK